jgi:hypothetical protein
MIYIVLSKKIITPPRHSICFFRKHHKSTPEAHFIKLALLWPSKAFTLGVLALSMLLTTQASKRKIEVKRTFKKNNNGINFKIFING